MRIQRLKLENFQGIQALEEYFSPTGNIVVGKNGAGKSTVLNAICWLVIGRPYDLAKGYTPKTTDERGREVHNLIHSAEADFRMPDGSMLRLAKTFRENWRKKRGSSQSEFAGHVIDYAVDNVPCKEKEYLARINAICPQQKALALMLPGYFAEDLKWQDRRALLLELAKEIEDATILEKMPDGGELDALLASNMRRYTVEEYMSIAKSSMAEANKELTTIGARIDEAQRSIPDLKLDEESVLTELQGQKAILEELMQQQVTLLEETKDSQYARRKNELMAALENEKARHIQEMIDKNAATQNEIWAVKNRIERLQSELHQEQQVYSDAEARQKELAAGFFKLKKRIQEEEAKRWKGETHCPICGQALPAEQIEEARAAFLEARDMKIAEYERLGKEKYSAKRFQDIADKMQKSSRSIDTLKMKLDEQEKKRSALKAPIQLQAETEEEIRLKQELEQLHANHTSEMGGELEPLQVKIDAVRSSIQKLETNIFEIQTAKNQEGRVRELKNRQKELGRQYEKGERGLWLCEQFIIHKANALNDSINTHFPTVRFTLYRPQINGGIESVCEVMAVTGTGLKPYSQANHVAKIQADMEIASVFSKLWTVDLPFLIDESQSITDFDFAGERQTVRAIAKRGYTLSVLTDEQWETNTKKDAA